MAQTATPAAAPAAAAPADKATLSYAIGYDMARDLAERKVDLDINTLDPRDPGRLRQEAADHAGRQAGRRPFPVPEEDGRAGTRRVRTRQPREQDQVRRVPRRQPRQARRGRPAERRAVQGHRRRQRRQADLCQHGLGASARLDFDRPGIRQHLLERERAACDLQGQRFPAGGPQGSTADDADRSSRWEVYLPADKAYGNDPRSPIGPSQAVVFDVKLVSIK